MKKNYLNLISIIFRVSIFIGSFVLVFYLINTYGIQKLRSSVDSMGALAPIGLFSLRSISIIIPALPSTAYSILAGALLGFKKGIITICLADLSSCLISFYLSREYGRKLIKKLIGAKFMNKVELISQKHLENNLFLMTGFLMTGLFDFVCYAVGLTRTPLKKFLPPLIISILLSNPPIVALGAGILDGGKQFLIFAVLGILSLAAITSKINVLQRIK
tara:strand:- start:1009 stop:1662 length:654 start_codon:yes stop_codon:yes gene_type:complete